MNSANQPPKDEIRTIKTIAELEADSERPHVAGLWYELSRDHPGQIVLANIDSITDKQIRAAIKELYGVDCKIEDMDIFLNSVDQNLGSKIPEAS